jgi:LysM repeat protein
MLSLLVSSAWGQERITVSGVEYIVHKVEKGQTLFAISKVYALPVDDIYEANPSVKGGLNTGQRLLIPVASVNKRQERSAPALVDGELAHTARRKETLFSIAKQYQVDLADLIERNPQVAGGLKEGTVLIIPVDRIRSLKPEYQVSAVEQDGRFHAVEPGETLYSISKMYDVPVPVLRELNRIEGNSISVGSTLRLPSAELLGSGNSGQEIDLRLEDSYDIAYLLPFSMVKNDTVMLDTDGKSLHPLTEIAMQFYFGARMALDTLKQKGLSANVSFMEVGQDKSAVASIERGKPLDSYDMIIGPFHRNILEEVATKTAPQRIPVICPVPQSNRIVMGHPNLLKVKSGRVEQIDAITSYAAKRNTPGNVIVFMADVESEQDLQRMALKSLRSKMPHIEIHEIYDLQDPNKFKTHFQLDKMNSVIIPSENLSVVSGLLTKLNGIAENHPMTVYGLEKWAEFDNIDLAYKEKLNVHLAMSSWIDRNDPLTAAFIKDFREEHKNDPSEYAFLGYDVTLYFGDRLRRTGRSFLDAKYEPQTMETLHLPVDMRTTGMDNGLRNVGVKIVDHNGNVIRSLRGAELPVEDR